MKRLIGSLIVGAAGVAAMLAGLATDAYLHARDETLAAREGIFTLGNPGHALLALGVAMTCGGIIVALYVAWGMAGARGVLGSRWLRLATAQAAGLAAVVAVLFSLSISEAGHDHAGEHAAAPGTHDAAPPAGDHVPAPATQVGEPAAAPASHTEAAASHATEPAMSTATHDAVPPAAGLPHTAAAAHTPAMPAAAPETDAHTHGVPSAASAEQAACGERLVADVRAATQRFEDFAVAEAEGYRNDTPDVKWVQHFGNPAYKRDGVTWDLGRPESLVYVRRLDGAMRLAGALYMAERGASGPQPCGGLTTWHTHSGCWDIATKQPAGQPVDGACPAGTVLHESREMIHVWTAHNPAGQIATSSNRPMVLALLQ